MNEDIIDLTANLLSNKCFKRSTDVSPDDVSPVASVEDQKFYRKRICRILKEMIKGKLASPKLQGLHDLYVTGVIEYIEEEDTNRELQKRYCEEDLIKSTTRNQTIPSSLCSSKVKRNTNDVKLLSCDCEKPRADIRRFVKVNSTAKEERIDYPRIQTINIRTDENRI